MNRKDVEIPRPTCIDYISITLWPSLISSCSNRRPTDVIKDVPYLLANSLPYQFLCKLPTRWYSVWHWDSWGLGISIWMELKMTKVFLDSCSFIDSAHTSQPFMTADWKVGRRGRKCLYPRGLEPIRLFLELVMLLSIAVHTYCLETTPTISAPWITNM